MHYGGRHLLGRQAALLEDCKTRAVHCPRFAVEALRPVQRFHRRNDVIAINGDFRAAQIRYHADCLFNGFDATKTASDRARHMPSSCLQRIGVGILQIHLNIKTLPGLDHFNGTDFRPGGYDALRETETDCEIDKIGGLAIITAWVLPP